MKDIVLPELGDRIEKATVAYWHCGPGTHVNVDDDVVEVATDKATFNIPAGMDGVIQEVCAEVGEEIAVGALLARVQTES